MRFLIILISLLVASGIKAEPLTKPTIEGINVLATQVVVTVSVPVGLTSVTLESRPQLGRGAWSPVGVKRTDGSPQQLTFNVARSDNILLFRVRATAQESLPSSFFSGTNNFAAPISNEPSVQYLANSSGLRDGLAAPQPNSGREVVESDIYKVANGKVYYFNHYRGLQVIDITEPQQPRLQGTFSFPGAGEQLYLAGPDHVVLLARDGCGWGQNGPASELVVLNVAEDTPQVAARVPFSGYIQESRMVGDALYVATYTYRRATNSTTQSTYWENGVEIYSFDLSSPSDPKQVDVFWINGYSTAIMATDQFLFVAIQNPTNYSQSTIEVIGIADAQGKMNRILQQPVAGRVNDKFKMNWQDNIFTVISEAFTIRSNVNVRATILETYRFPDPLAFPPISTLGLVEVGHGEQLYGTRFDGDKAYIVTFLRIDPLWIVDLSDPRNPRVAGELEIPGFSTYIEPLGDRLVTIGYDNSNSWRVAVSLFDVSDPSNPILLSKVPLGENSSWSEAAHDEKAFNVIAESGLILVPFSAWGTNAMVQAVQLIDLERDELTLRGQINHDLTPRRAFMAGSQVLSLSGREMLSVNIDNRDQPVVTTELDLSWNVDRVFVKGKYLIQLPLTQNNYFFWRQNEGEPARIRITSSTNVDHVLATVELTNSLQIAGAELRGDYLYIAQTHSSAPWYWWSPQATAETENLLVVSAFYVGSLPEIRLTGSSTIKLAEGGMNNLTPVWPNESTLVWSGGFQGYYRYPFLAFDSIGVSMPWFGFDSSRWQFAYDVSNPEQPVFASTNNIVHSTNSYIWNVSSAYASNNLVFQSYETSEFREDIQRPPYVYRSYDGTNYIWVTNTPTPGAWVQVTFLQVIDYTDSSSPVRRTPLKLPGKLSGLSHAGSLLYTTGYKYNPTNYTTDYSEWVDAIAYDGVNVSLVDSIPVGNRWPHPVYVHRTNVFVHRTETNRYAIEKWALSLASGKFEQSSSLELQQPLRELHAEGDLLFGSASGRFTVFAGAQGDGPLRNLGEYIVPGCMYPQINRLTADSNRVWIPLGEYGLDVFNLQESIELFSP